MANNLNFKKPEIKFNFTKAAINTLAIPELGKRSSYHDSKTAGLRLRITSSGVVDFILEKLP